MSELTLGLGMELLRVAVEHAQLNKFHVRAVQQRKHFQMQLGLAGQQRYSSKLQFGNKWYNKIPVAI